MTYADALAFLHALPRFADAGAAAFQPGLERMRALLDAMDHPEARFPSLHIAGTNGKGSTASFAAAIATASGLQVGLHTSPHLFDFAERMRLDGQPAPQAWVAEAVGRHRRDVERIGPSFFEASVALSFLYFAEQAVDLAVVEVGLGGRLDGTNVLRPVACGITHIGRDHTDLLGDSLAAIAREKAGIAKPGVPLLSAVADAEAHAAIGEVTKATGAPFEAIRETITLTPAEESSDRLTLRTPLQEYGAVRLGLAGRHQYWNAALAVRLAEIAVPQLSAGAVHTGLAEVVHLSGLQGRAEIWQHRPRIVADVAHNADGWRAALAVAQPEPGGRLFALVGMLADKDAEALAVLLAQQGATALPVALPSPRALSVAALTACLKAQGVPVQPVADIRAGLKWFSREATATDVLLVTGSHGTVEALQSATPELRTP
ncbi:MAG: bifunctional folylpolyglutamate synthase/dihydrofolate synthase [Rhodothermaceae bacterium]|nr:bifunctional folylpolyglutamate synthase/dihydrofolate synthase [Rhodothermaceae bacterium]